MIAVESLRFIAVFAHAKAVTQSSEPIHFSPHKSSLCSPRPHIFDLGTAVKSRSSLFLKRTLDCSLWMR